MEKLIRLFNKINIKIDYKTNNNLLNTLNKTEVTQNNTECRECNNFYVDQTKENIKKYVRRKLRSVNKTRDI